MSVPAVHDYGPYTLYDLDALPEDGKQLRRRTTLHDAGLHQLGQLVALAVLGQRVKVVKGVRTIVVYRRDTHRSSLPPARY